MTHIRLPCPPPLPLSPPRLAAPLAVAALLALFALLPGCGSAPGGPPRLACSQLPAALAAMPGLNLTEAEDQPADARGHPAHCRVRGTLAERRGRDGRHYAIGFEMRLPADWSGRFLHQANGGSDGVVVPAYGALATWPVDALSRGFAVLSSDAGHDAADIEHAWAGLARGHAFGLDPQARRDHADGAVEALWPLAQALITHHYGVPPHHQYLAGCGNGGRQALVAASRPAQRFDGLLAAGPGFNLPRAALQAPWDVQQAHRAGSDLRRLLSPADLQRVADKLLERCDGLDLLVDGVVGDLRRCQRAFRLADLQCPGDDDSPGSAAASRSTPGACLPAAQLQALAAMFGGPRNASGQPLYSDWPFDPGIAAAGWRAWRLDSGQPGWDRLPIAATLGAANLAYVLTSPPARLAGTPAALLNYLQRYDVERDAGRLFAGHGGYDAASALMTPADGDDPRLEALERRGGKLLVYQGASDPLYSVNDTLRWTERLQANLGQDRAQALQRSFVVPGMGRCAGGPATDQFDALGALVDWVEQGRPPAQIDAAVNPANADLPAAWSRQRHRLLCPWPQVPRYAGGPVEAAASFRCATP